MKYNIYQFQVTDDNTEMWFKVSGLHPSVENIMSARKEYVKVSVIEADNIDQAFEIGNIGPESAIERLHKMRSVSVGDVVVDEDGDAYLCDSFGWKKIKDFV